MSRPDPPLHSRWKPGQSGNPSGSRKRALTQEKYTELVEKLVLDTPHEELRAIVDEKKGHALQIMLASGILEAIDKGDYSRLESLLARTLGRVKDVVETHVHNYDGELDKEPQENVIALLRQLRGPKIDNGT